MLVSAAEGGAAVDDGRVLPAVELGGEDSEGRLGGLRILGGAHQELELRSPAFESKLSRVTGLPSLPLTRCSIAVVATSPDSW